MIPRGLVEAGQSSSKAKGWTTAGTLARKGEAKGKLPALGQQAMATLREEPTRHAAGLGCAPLPAGTTGRRGSTPDAVNLGAATLAGLVLRSQGAQTLALPCQPPTPGAPQSKRHMSPSSSGPSPDPTSSSPAESSRINSRV